MSLVTAFTWLQYFSPSLCQLTCCTQFTLFNRREKRETGICLTALRDGFDYSHLLALAAKFREERSPLKTHTVSWHFMAGVEFGRKSLDGSQAASADHT